MNELRWILIAAGIVLIAGLYLWGTRSRWQGRGEPDEARRPAVFTGGARGFETDLDEATTADEAPAALRAESRAERRIEPSFGDADVAELDDPQGRHADFDEVEEFEEFETPAIARREPTLAARPESARPLSAEPSPQPETAAGQALETPGHGAATAEPPAVVAEPATSRPKRAQKIVAIRVSAAESSLFEGPQLLAALRAEGLGFGRYEIFHHLHDDGRPIFSVASLREPGTFDLAAMPTTLYPGIAMFTVLPGPVPAGEAFDEMIFTARALATYLNGALADERGVPLTAQRVGKLREEVLEFERTAGSA
jgi:cell division protein ZipA